MIYENILETIGNTPVVKLQRVAPENQNIYAKLEAFNPLASVKDRLAIAIIEDAEKSGALKPGQTVVKGYPFVATMVETFSVERRKIMKALGARVILTPAAEKGSGMVRRAEELAKQHGWFLASQFENPANPAYHRNTTGPEILRDFAGKDFDYFVTGWGTGGTMTGASQMIKLARPEVKIIATEPAAAALLSGNDWQPHKIQGWTPDFIPGVLDKSVVDELVPVTDEEAIETAKRLSSEEGIFCGISAGGTMAAALKVAANAPANSSFVVMLPDTGERYLSSPLFADISEESDDEWLASL